MDLTHQLTPMLKSLRLSGILETLEVRNRGAIESKLSYVEFLAQLVEDEVERRAQHKLKMRLRRAAFDPQKSLETFVFSACPKLSQKEIAYLATCRFIERHENVFFVGPAGVGKSHLAQALGHQACRRGHDVMFTTCSRLLAELAGGHADRSFAARIRKLAKTAVLIVDDFAMREFTPAQADDLYELLCERLGRPGRSLILTSNRSPADWYPLFPNPVVGESILDRVVNTSHHLLLDGNSYRPRRRPGQTAPATRRQQ
jgi:DNA replication protein DnaC